MADDWKQDITDDRPHTIRTWDNAEGENEMHRHSRSGGKQPGKRMPEHEPGEAMRAAIRQAKTSYARMIEGWDR